MEIQSYQELTTYAGTTIVENAADCYMEVSAGGGDALRAKKAGVDTGRSILAELSFCCIIAVEGEDRNGKYKKRNTTFTKYKSTNDDEKHFR